MRRLKNSDWSLSQMDQESRIPISEKHFFACFKKATKMGMFYYISQVLWDIIWKERSLISEGLICLP